jgi:hypothetical protein
MTSADVKIPLRTPKNFSENYPQSGHALSESFASPALGWRNVKNIRLNGRPDVSGRSWKALGIVVLVV